MAFVPENEMGVIVKFSQEMHLYGWEIVSIQIRYPDAILRKNGIEYLAEFEYESSSFIEHKHDIRNADVIVCWVNNFQDCPLPVIALSDPAWGEVQPQKVDDLVKEAEYWKRRALSAEYQIRCESSANKMQDAWNDNFNPDIYSILSTWLKDEYQTIVNADGLIKTQAPWAARANYPLPLKKNMRRFLIENSFVFVSSEKGNRWKFDIRKYRDSEIILKAIAEKLT